MNSTACLGDSPSLECYLPVWIRIPVKKLKNILLTGLIVLGLGLIGLFAAAEYFKDDIVASVLKELNKQLVAPVAIDEVDFSLIREFPSASVEFKTVWVADATDHEDTLLTAANLSLEFDIMDLLSEEYTLEQINIRDGQLRMRTLADGQFNYIIWNQDTLSSAAVDFAIDRLFMQNVAFSYVDEPVNVEFYSMIDQAKMTGDFSDGWMDMLIGLEGHDASLRIEGLDYLLDNQIAIAGGIAVDEEASDFKFTACEVSIGDVEVPLNGRIWEEEDWHMDLALSGSTGINAFLAELPEVQKGSLAQYAPQGDVDFSMKIHGASTEDGHPRVDMDFDLRNGAMRFSAAAEPLGGILAKGRYVRDEKGLDHLHLTSLDAELPSGQIHYAGAISDLAHPMVNGDLSLRAELSELVHMTGLEAIDPKQGTVRLDLKVKGRLPDDMANHAAWERVSMSGSLDLLNLGFDLAEAGTSITELSAKAEFKDADLNAPELSFLLDDELVTGRLKVNGLLAYALTDDADLIVDGALSVNALDLTRFGEGASDAESQEFQIPERLRLSTSLDLAALQIDGFHASDLHAVLKTKDAALQLDDLSFATCGGTMQGSVELKPSTDRAWDLRTTAECSSIDIRELFTQFDQFGQDFLQDKHVKGKGDAEIDFRASYDQDWNLDRQSLVANADIRLQDGELIQHPAMSDIMAAVNEKKLLRPFVRTHELEQELQHIRFKTLENTISIDRGRVQIPAMRIASDAMEIVIAGEHTFEQNIDYRIAFNLRDVLINTDNPEFLIEDDGLGHVIHLKMSGTTANPEIGLDKEQVKENRKEAIAEAKTDIRDFFNAPLESKKEQSDSDTRSAVQVEIVGANTDGQDNNAAGADDKAPSNTWWEVEDEEDEEAEEDDW